jgi:uncharacterized membrane protein SpoIIM required for sporulation/uncharacterized RDD family membrane protein YckC
VSPEARDATTTRLTSGLDQVIEIETPEQVTVTVTIAGIGSRAAAAVIDALIILLVLFASWLLLIAPGVGLLGEGAWVLAIGVIATFALFWGYYVLFEGLRDGQTPGKRLLGLRVVQDGGYSVSLAASAVRNIVRLLDMQPFPTGLLGLTVALVSRSGKRLGDMAAGTIVVREHVHHAAAPVVEREDAGAEPAVLTESEYELLERYMSRRDALDPTHRYAIAEQMAHRLEDRLPQASTPLAALIELHRRERLARARGGAARGARGAEREQHALVARGSARWQEFSGWVARARQRGLAAMSEREVTEFVARYREVATDLARLRTASGGREHDAIYNLSRLVAAGHNLLYRQRSSPGRAAWRYLTSAVPAEIRGSWMQIALAALLLFGPAIATYLAIVRSPQLAYELMPAGMIERAESARAREALGEGYLPKDEEAPLPLLASEVATNNIGVTFAAFASGMTAGVLTVFLLAFNGVMIGGAVGLFASMGVGHLIWAFVAPHGVLELFAICVAGGGAFHLASAILLPGARTRREALVVRGRRAIRLIAGATLLLVVAGAIEGFISPRVWPIEWKFAVSAVTAVFLALFLSLGRRGAADDVAERFAYSDARALSSR